MSPQDELNRFLDRNARQAMWILQILAGIQREILQTIFDQSLELIDGSDEIDELLILLESPLPEYRRIHDLDDHLSCVLYHHHSSEIFCLPIGMLTQGVLNLSRLIIWEQKGMESVSAQLKSIKYAADWTARAHGMIVSCEDEGYVIVKNKIERRMSPQ